MQFGIISHAPTKEGRTEEIVLGLVDYTNPRTDGLPAVFIHFKRKAKSEYKVVLTHCATLSTPEEVSEVAAILTSLGNIRKKHGESTDCPAGLIDVMTRQIGRHVVWDAGSKSWVRTAKLDTDEDSWRALVGGKEFSVRATSEDLGRQRIVAYASEDAIGDLSKAQALTQWIGSGAEVEAVKPEEDAMVVHPLSNYARRSAENADAKKSS